MWLSKKSGVRWEKTFSTVVDFPSKSVSCQYLTKFDLTTDLSFDTYFIVDLSQFNK